MTPLTLSFTDALWDLGDRVGINFDPGATPTQGTAVVGSTLDSRRLAQAISKSYKWAYEAPAMPWPETVNGIPDISVTNFGIPWSAIDFGRWWDLWSVDPRPFPQANVYSVGSRYDADGIWLRPEALGLGTVFAFRQDRTPEFTYVAWDDTKTYKADDLVWDSGNTVTGNGGQCYRALKDVSADTPLTDTTNWALQTFSKFLEDAVLMAAHGRWLRALGEFEEGKELQGDAQDRLEREFVKAFPKGQQTSFPWGSGCWGIY